MVITIVLTMFLGGCGIFSGGDDATADTEVPSWRRNLPTTSTTASDTGPAEDPIESTTTTDSSRPTSASPAKSSVPLVSKPCLGLEVAEGVVAESPFLSEASGVVASSAHPDLLWTHNDSGSRAAVVAIGTDGTNLGAFALPIESSFDIEDIALVDGMLYLADIGDNDQVRSEIAIYRFAEPDPSSPTPIEEVETIRVHYPDGAHDAEAFLIDPLSGQMIIIDKTFALDPTSPAGPLAPAPASVWVASPPFGPNVELEEGAILSVDQLASLASAPPATGLVGQLGIGGLATGADIRSDGELVAIRTYDTVWLFEREPDQTVARALVGQPCEAPTRPEEQGEAVGFLDGSSRAFVTIAEGTDPTINLTVEQE